MLDRMAFFLLVNNGQVCQCLQVPYEWTDFGEQGLDGGDKIAEKNNQVTFMLFRQQPGCRMRGPIEPLNQERCFAAARWR